MARGAPGREESAAQLATIRALNQQPAAILIGWTPRGLRDSDAPRKKDGSYDGTKLVAWHVERQVTAGRGPLTGLGGDGEIFEGAGGGDSSPNLERCRAETARKLKRENDRADEQLIEVEIVGTIIDEVGRVWRERVKSIQQTFGQEFAEVISDMVDDAFVGLKDGVARAKERKVKAV